MIRVAVSPYVCSHGTVRVGSLSLPASPVTAPWVAHSPPSQPGSGPPCCGRRSAALSVEAAAKGGNVDAEAAGDLPYRIATGAGSMQHPGADPCLPASTCSPGYAYAGYWRGAIPGTGQSASAGVKWNAGTVQGPFPSHLAGWVGVDDQAGHWIQAGVYKDNGSGLIKYLEYKTTSGHTFIPKGSASSGTVYTASVAKVAAGSWTASIGGSPLGSNISLSGMNTTQYQGESNLNSSGMHRAQFAGHLGGLLPDHARAA